MCNNHKKSNRELNQKLYYNLKNEDSSRVWNYNDRKKNKTGVIIVFILSDPHRSCWYSYKGDGKYSADQQKINEYNTC